MSDRRTSRLTRPETLTALGLILISAGLLIPTIGMRPISALLPASMLVALIVLSIVLLIRDQRKAASGEPAAPMTESPHRVAGAFALVVLYAVATDVVGFYPATVVTVPLVAWLFGFRNPLGLLLATVIVVGSIWLIFDLAMNERFPTGIIWE